MITKQNIKNLIDSLKRYIPTGTHKHSSNVVTDRGPSFLIAELIREQMFIKLGDEIPYGATVATESYENLEKLVKIKAIIVVEKKGHKAIVIGNKGETLKKIASPARLELQKHLMKKVFLEVWVKVQGGWTDSNFKLRELGF